MQRNSNYRPVLLFKKLMQNDENGLAVFNFLLSIISNTVLKPPNFNFRNCNKMTALQRGDKG